MRKSILYSLIALLAISACSTVALTGRKQLNLVSNTEVLSSSFQQYHEFIQTAPLSTNKANTALVEKVGKKVSDAVERYFKENNMSDRLEGYAWEYKLVQNTQANAFCMPGGKIVVYEGILSYTKDENGLAVVIGHEVAHAVARHSNERMSQQLLVSAGNEVLGMALSEKSELVQALGATVYGLGSQVGVMLPFSRKHESEADYLGLIFMAMAGYDPTGAIGFWERMSTGGASVPELLSTHPSDKTRIEQIQKELPKALEYYKK